MKNNYLSGLKGVCAISLTLLHFLITFASYGYIDYESGIAEADKYAYYFKYFPYSILTNMVFFLYIFFALIAYIPALHFFKNHDVKWIQKQAIIRYFRLMPYIMVCCLITYVLYIAGAFYNKELGSFLHIQWSMGFYPDTISFLGAIKSGLYATLFARDDTYNAVFWCMQTIFNGSYLSYACLLLFGNQKNRWLIYVLLFVLFFKAPIYLSFLGGIVAADIITHNTKKPNALLLFAMFTLSLVFGFFPPVLLPAPITTRLLFGFGSCLFLITLAYSNRLQSFFNLKFLQKAGEYSFSLIIVHLFVMLSFSAWFFLKIFPSLGFVPSVLITFVLTVILLFFTTILFQKIADPIAKKLCNKVYPFFVKKDEEK